MLSFLFTSLIRYKEKTFSKQENLSFIPLFMAEIIILEIKFYKGAKRLRGERESGRNDSGANGKVGETTRG